MPKRGLGKALERKMGLDDEIFSKISVKKVSHSLLMNPTRLSIFEFVCNIPASHLRMIARGIRSSHQTVKWHLKKLNDANLVSSFRIGSKKVFVPFLSLITRDESKVLALFYREDTKRVFNFIRTNTKSTQTDLEKALDIYQQRLSRILLILEDHELITHEKAQGKKVYFATDFVELLINSFDSKKDRLKALIMAAFKANGLAPEPVSEDSQKLEIEIDVPGNRRYCMQITKNPALALIVD